MVNGLPVDVVHKDIKNLHLAVYPPDGRVRVAAPLRVNDEAVRLAVISKLAWIRRQQARFDGQERQSAREFVSGESHYFQGKRYLLNVVYHAAPPKVILRNKTTLDLFVRTLRRHGGPDVLYLDNGSTYRGDTLRLGCERLGVTLLHAAPYDPEARGKMERFWGTLRGQCLNFLGSLTSLHEVNVRLYAFIDKHYHGAPHAGLMGKVPGAVFADGQLDRPIDLLNEAVLRDALTVKERRRVRRDTTVSVDGQDYELEQGFLAGRVVTVGYCVIDTPRNPWVELEGKRLALHPVDPKQNATRKRPDRRPKTDTDATQQAAVAFEPNEARLRALTGKTPAKGLDHDRR